MQHFVRGDGVQHVLQARSIWPVQEELLPEAVGQLRVFVVLLSHVVSDASTGDGGGGKGLSAPSHLEQGFIEADDLGLEDFGPRVLREGGGFHGAVAVNARCVYGDLQ
jgi:hypothetical protein